MSAAQWLRRAMNSAAGGAAAHGGACRVPRGAGDRARRRPARPAPIDAQGAATRWIDRLRRAIGPRHVLVAALVLLLPLFATPFILFQVAAQSLVLGLIALSLTFLGGYGGMVSLAQMTVAGIAGYALAVLGHSSAADISLGWPWWAALPIALLISTLCATLIGWLSVRTEGIYTIMITLAMGVAFYYLVLQNYSVFNGFQGLREVYPPKVFGVAWRDPLPFYFLSLGCCDGRLLPGPLAGRRAVRQGPARHPRQPAADERARASRSSPTASPPTRSPASSPVSAASSSSGTTA